MLEHDFETIDASLVITEVNEIIADYPDASLDYLADDLERGLDTYDQEPEFGRKVIAELRRRAAVMRASAH